MKAKLLALFTTASGWSLIVSFLVAGFTAISGHGGNVTVDIITALTFLGGMLHPTNMTAGRSVPPYLR